MDFENLKMKELDLVEEFMIQVMDIVNQLRMNGEEHQDHKVVEKVFRNLPKNFYVVVVAIEESTNLTQLLIDKMLGYFLSHESRINRNDDICLENTSKSQVCVSRGREILRSRGRARSIKNNDQRDSKEYSKQERRPYQNPHISRGRNTRRS